MTKIKFAPTETWEQIKKWVVIPVFDLVIEYGDQGVVMVKRKIPPYQNQWALPGLRMHVGESIDDVIGRIAKEQLGLSVDSSKREYVGQFVGRFATRQDLSTAYALRTSSDQEITINQSHLSSVKLVKSRDEIPSRTGAMYKFYLNKFFAIK